MSRGLACKEFSDSYKNLSKATSNIFPLVRRKRSGRSMSPRSGMPASFPASPTRRHGIRKGAPSPGNAAGFSLHFSWSPSRRGVGGWNRAAEEQASRRAPCFCFRPATGTGIAPIRKRAGPKTGWSCVAPRSTPGWRMGFWTWPPSM